MFLQKKNCNINVSFRKLLETLAAYLIRERSLKLLMRLNFFKHFFSLLILLIRSIRKLKM